MPNDHHSPRMSVRLTDSGAGRVLIGARSHTLSTRDARASMSEAKRLMADEAQRQGRALSFTAHEPDGSTEVLQIDPAGKVTEPTEEPAPGPAGDEESELWAQLSDTETDPQPADEHEPEPAEEDEHEDTPPAPEQHTHLEPAPEPEPEPTKAAPLSPLPVSAATPKPATDNAAGGLPMDAPAPAAVQFIDRESEGQTTPAESGWRGWMNRTLGMRIQPGHGELAQRDAQRRLSTRWVGSRTIAVLNSKGGANKTPTVLRLASELSIAGGGGVLAWDNNESLGTLGWRSVSSSHESTVLDLLDVAPHFLEIGAHSADLEAYVHHQPEDGFDVLRSDERPEHDHIVTGGEVSLLHEVAARNWRCLIMDSGNSTRGENFSAMIDHTDQVVLATTSESDKAQGAVNSLQALHARGGHAAELARNAVVIVSELNPKHAMKAREIVEKFEPIVRAVHVVPHDPALIQGVMRAQDLAPATRRAWQLAAASVIDQF